MQMLELTDTGRLEAPDTPLSVAVTFRVYSPAAAIAHAPVESESMTAASPPVPLLPAKSSFLPLRAVDTLPWTSLMVPLAVMPSSKRLIKVLAPRNRAVSSVESGQHGDEGVTSPTRQGETKKKMGPNRKSRFMSAMLLAEGPITI